jgi:hypothetical protein
METHCTTCEEITEQVAITDVIKDKKLNTDGYHYWQKTACTCCGVIQWVNRGEGE